MQGTLKGRVFLVGAGPGDPGLITVKGIETLRRADLVVYDYLANKKFLNELKPKAQAIYVGKKGAFHSREQEAINRLLIRHAREGKVVVRLKGGDPFVFGRGGEEAEALAQAGIPFEIVPGVTSPIAVPAYAGIPVTHRDFTSVVAFVTGHEKDEEGASPPDWKALSKIGTVVFLMGYANLPRIVKNLIDAGRDPSTPAAVIEWGTLPRQRKVIGTLASLVEKVNEEKIRPPTIVVVGQVVSLNERLAWFEKKPLFGKKILVTRSREQAGLLSGRLEEIGAEVLEVPTIEIRPPTTWRGLDRAIRSLSRCDWIVFTSVNGVDSFFGRLQRKGRDLRDLEGIRVAVVGPATASFLSDKGIRADLVADEFRSEGLVRALARKRLKGKRILMPRAKEGREVLIEGLRNQGATVDVVEAYRAVPVQAPVPETLKKSIEEGQIDLVTFTSAATVENFVAKVGFSKALKKIPVASIGPVTTEAARRLGLSVTIQPRRSTIAALVEAIVRHFDVSR